MKKLRINIKTEKVIISAATRRGSEKFKEACRAGHDLPTDLDQIASSIRLTIINTGETPKRTTIAKPVLYGPYAGTTNWNALNARLQYYAKRNPDCGFHSISTFIDHRQLAPDIDSEQILEDIVKTIRLTSEEIKRKPIKESKLVKYGPYAGKIRWDALDRWLVNYSKDHPECGFKDLASFIEAREPAIATLRSPATMLAKISETIVETIKETKKKPHVYDGDVLYGPLKGMNWLKINGYLRRHALRNPDCGFNSIATYIEAKDLAKDLTSLPAKVAATHIPIYIYVIRKTFEAGKRIKANEECTIEPLAGIKWFNMNARLAKYALQNPECGFNSVTTLCKKEGLVPPGKSLSRGPGQNTEQNGESRPGRTKISLDTKAVLDAALEVLNKGEKIVPDSLVASGPLAGIKWYTVNARLRAYRSENPDCGFYSVTSLVKKHLAETGTTLTTERTPLKSLRHAKDIYNLAAADIKRTGKIPPLEKGFIKSKFERASVEQINQDLKSGKITGLEEIFGNAAKPENFEEFLLAANLVQQKLVLPKQANPAPEV